MGKKLICLTTGLLLVMIIGLSFVSAFAIKSVNPVSVNRSVNTLINFTINNTDAANITQITITLPMEAVYLAGSNGTEAASASLFTNQSGGGPQMSLVWTNITADGILPNMSQTRSFWFNASIRNLISFRFTNITISASHMTGSDTESSYNYIVYFAFSGYVLNETGGNESNVNITISQVSEGQGGPPTQTLEANVLSAADGSFLFPSVNGSATAYKIKMIKYGPYSTCVTQNATCNATKVGSSLPSFPAQMYYPTTVDMPQFAFMRPPSLNGTSFYLQPAATLRLYANNNSGQQKFGYEVVDQTVGFPTESNIMTSASSVDIIVPIGRNYTAMFSRFPSFLGSSFGFGFDPACDGSFMNDTLCPSPPISNSSLGTLTAGQILIVNQSLVTGNYRLTGCINAGGNNNSVVNITTLSLKMVPWIGFVPPNRGDRGDINITTDVSYNFTLHPECNSTNYNTNAIAWYNISVMGSVSGINYMLEFYAKNATSEAGNPGTANNLAVFQNVTIGNANQNLNLTLYKLAGAYYQNAGGMNTSMFRINIQNSSGGAITNNLNANVQIKNLNVWGTQTMTYIIESMSSGTFYMPFLNNTKWAKVMVMSNEMPPKEITLNLSNAEQNITLITMSDGRGVGLKRINSSGQAEMINSSQLDVSMPISMKFLRNTGSCNNIISPDPSCVLTSMQAKNFNPLTALIAGKVNVEMKITSTNVTLTFVDFDMFAAKQPPMESVMNDQVSSGAASTNQVWQFGSFAPANTYDYAVIAMPYSESGIDDSAAMRLSVPYFYDENWKVAWNSSKGDIAANLTDDFIDYNSSALYRGYLSTAGVTCSKTDSSLSAVACYVNTTSNMIYMRVPHFSGVAPGVSGSAPATASSSSSSGSGGGGGALYSLSVKESDIEAGVTKTLLNLGQIEFTLLNETHSIKLNSANVSTKTVSVTVSSTPQTFTMSENETKKVNLNGDNYYDLQIWVKRIFNGGAEFYVKKINELIPASQQANATAVEEQAAAAGTPSAGEKAASSWASSWLLWLGMVGIAIVVIAIVVSVIYHKKRRYYRKGY